MAGTTDLDDLPDWERLLAAERHLRWFGPRVSQPGTAFEAQFHAGPDGLWIEPLRSNVKGVLQASAKTSPVRDG